MPKNKSITDIPGIKVGHAQDDAALTGCTVVLCEKGAVAGVSQKGGAPGTRETDLLRPMHTVQKVHAILLSGGSAFGLDAASGVVKYLNEKGVGYETGVARVPIVPAAILFDLSVGKSNIWPDASMGYLACSNASRLPPKEGNFGAGTGATVGKIFGNKGAMKSGIGTACEYLDNNILVGALIAVNPFGDVIDPATGDIIAGSRPVKIGPLQFGHGDQFADTLATMKSRTGKVIMDLATRGNTIIGVVATNALLSKEEANIIAEMAHDGIARTIRPAHTMLDGDTLFALSSGKKRADISTIGAIASQVVAEAILRAVRSAKEIDGLPSISSLIR